MIEDEPGWIYAQREGGLRIIEFSKKRYDSHSKKEELWGRSRKIAAIAPFVASSAIMAYSNFEGYEEKGVTLALSLAAGVIGYINTDVQRLKQKAKSYEVAKHASLISDQLGLNRARWMEEGLQKREVGHVSPTSDSEVASK